MLSMIDIDKLFRILFMVGGVCLSLLLFSLAGNWLAKRVVKEKVKENQNKTCFAKVMAVLMMLNIKIPRILRIILIVVLSIMGFTMSILMLPWVVIWLGTMFME